jgi:hypothetical protein
VVGVAHDADDVLATVGEQPGEPQGDLPVAAGDHDPHQAVARICS